MKNDDLIIYKKDSREIIAIIPKTYLFSCIEK